MKILLLILGSFSLTELASILFFGEWKPSLWFALSILPFAIALKKNALINVKDVAKGFVFCFLFVLINVSVVWGVKTFPLNDAFQVVQTIKSPLNGFSMIFVKKYLLEVLALSFLLSAFVAYYLLILLRNGLKRLWLYLVCACILLYNVVTLLILIPTGDYADYLFDDDSLSHSAFFENNYVSVSSDDVVLDSNGQRNLIFIIMESMENSFANVDDGENLIESLVSPQEDEYHFSHDNSIGGGVDVYGSGITISAIMSKTTGVPQLLRKRIDLTMLYQTPSIYDLMKCYGYYNVFVQGTDADFEAERPFVQSHGIDVLYDERVLNEFRDVEKGKGSLKNGEHKMFEISITDRSLFDVSKKILDTLALKRNFSLSILTVETHFPYGFFNDACEEKPENASEKASLKATIKCASKDVRNFVNWVKQQPFYKNTEIVIVGDHLFAGKYLVQEHKDNRRWIDLFINPEKIPTRLQNRDFSSLDMAPTILESLGFNLRNHRMGFGISLYSKEKTLLESLGLDSLNRNLRALEKSYEYDALNSLDSSKKQICRE